MIAMGPPSLAGFNASPCTERYEVGPSTRDLAELQSKVDQAYRLAWLAGDDVTSERLRRYAQEMEASMTPL
jgi:hypothetical protein